MTTAGDDALVQNKEIIRRQFEEIWNQGRSDLIRTYYSSAWSNFGVQRDLDHFQQIVEAWRTAFPDLHYTLDEQLAEGDQVFSHCSLSGTHLGLFSHPSWGNLAPTGKTFTVKHMHLFRLDDGKIVEHWAVRDDLGMLQQLGLVSLPG
jgi:predicted ester cyclase